MHDFKPADARSHELVKMLQNLALTGVSVLGMLALHWVEAKASTLMRKRAS